MSSGINANNVGNTQGEVIVTVELGQQSFAHANVQSVEISCVLALKFYLFVEVLAIEW